MEKKRLEHCRLDQMRLKEVIALGVFGSYHEHCFIKEYSDIDILILLKRELEWGEEIEIEDYLDSILPNYFQHSEIHYTFLKDFAYPFGELLLMSQDKIILEEESYLDYVLGYSSFKRDRENLEIIREVNLKELEKFRNGLL